MVGGIVGDERMMRVVRSAVVSASDQEVAAMLDPTTALLDRLQEVDAACTPEERSLLRAMFELAASADPDAAMALREAGQADVSGFAMRPILQSEPDPFPFDMGQGALRQARRFVTVRGMTTGQPD